MANAKKSAPKLESSLLKSYETLDTKSSQIRLLASNGIPRGDIARFMNIRYQHVRNVLEQPLKKA